MVELLAVVIPIPTPVVPATRTHKSGEHAPANIAVFLFVAMIIFGFVTMVAEKTFHTPSRVCRLIGMSLVIGGVALACATLVLGY